jgi:hypothetical protein
MHANVQVHNIINSLSYRVHRLEATLLGTGHEHTHIHTRRERHGEGVLKVQQYMKEFKHFYTQNTVFFPNGFPTDNTMTSLSLQLDDEDSRYTTDVSPGIHCKQKIFEEYDNWAKSQGGGSIQEKLLVWDLFCSPGMDILYFMIQDYMMGCMNNGEHPTNKRRLEIVGVSKSDTTHLIDRFERMKHNVKSLWHFLPGIQIPNLIANTAQEYCQGYHGRTPDIVCMSPPWMETMGEMMQENKEIERTTQAIIQDICNLTMTILRNTGGNPNFIVISVPYSWDSFKSILIDLNTLNLKETFALCTSIEIIKKSEQNHNYTISSYFTFIIAKNGPENPTFHEFIYYV